VEFTGERHIPSLKGQISYEHVHRYAIAARYAQDKRVLDIASGEGYGAALLAHTAAEVVGVDIDREAVEHARRSYYASNLRFVCGSVTDIPLADASVDVVASFETIEHVGEQDRMLDEIRRVLVPGGVAIISSPNKLVYSDGAHFSNPYHVRELYFAELRDLLVRRFRHVGLYGQRLAISSLVHPLAGSVSSAPSWFSGGADRLTSGLSTLDDPVYFVAICSDSPHAADASSAYLDPGDDVFAGLWVELTQLREHVSRTLNASAAQAALPEASAEPAALGAGAAQERHAEHERALQRAGELEAEVAELRAQIAAQRAAIEEEHAAALDALRTAQAQAVAALRSADDERLSSVRSEYEAALAALRAEHGEQLAAAHAEHDSHGAARLSEHEAQLAALRSEHGERLAAAQSEHEAQRAAMQSEHEARLAAVQSHCDAQLAAARSEYESRLAQAEGERERDAARVKALHDDELSMLRSRHDAETARREAAHEIETVQLRATFSAECGELRAELDALRASADASSTARADAAERIKRELDAIHGELARARDGTAAVAGELARERARAGALAGELAALRAESGRRESAAAAALANAEALRAQLNAELERAQRDSEALREVLASHSWKLTSPLRRAVKLVRR